MIGFIDAFFVQSLLITINYKNSHSIFSRTLLPWLPRTHPILVLVLRLSSLLRWLTWFWFTSHSLLIDERLLICNCTDCRLQCEWLPIYECTTYMGSRRIHRRHIRYCWEVLSALCAITSTTRTTENTAPVLLATCLLERVYRAVA
jgi:hypothetical protein